MFASNIMVVFTCQHCGESIQKPKVEKHYFQTKCRSTEPFLTCVDCLKDFRGDEYTKHTNCVTEEQRYGAKGTVFKTPKGQTKQQNYTEMIQNILNSKELGLNNTQRRLLEICSNHSNVPRKLKKFQNFMKNAARTLKYSEADLKSVFDLLEDNFKQLSGKTTSTEMDTTQTENKPLNDSSDQISSKKHKKVKNGTTKNESKELEEMDATDCDNGIENKPLNDSSDKISSKKHKKAKNGTTKNENTELEELDATECDNGIENKPLNDSSDKISSKKHKKAKKGTTKNENTELDELGAECDNGAENKCEVEVNKIKKKRKLDAAPTEHNGKRAKTTSDTEEERAAFDWAEMIVKVLESRSGKKLSLCRLGKKIIQEYETVRPNDHRTYEQLLAKFNKKIKKTPGVVVLKDKARLTNQ